MSTAITLIVSFTILIIIVLIVEVLLAGRGSKEQFINPKRISRIFGKNNKSLRYLVMGDSTSAGQGGDYELGIAVASAKHLAQDFKVDFLNTSISGAKIKDLINEQLTEGLKFNPDIILISAGANDVVRLTNIFSLENQLNHLISQIKNSNSKAKIILTGSPEVGAVPRFAQPLRFIAGLHTKNVNIVFKKVIKKHNLILAPIAKETGPIFKQDKTLFASDKFHPNNRGYAEWSKVLNPVLLSSLKES